LIDLLHDCRGVRQPLQQPVGQNLLDSRIPTCTERGFEFLNQTHSKQTNPSISSLRRDMQSQQNRSQQNRSQQKSSRAMGLFALLAASLVACPNGGGSTPFPTGQPLSIEVRANTVAMTVFVNANDGSLLESKTAGANTGKQTLTFSNIPSNATVTRGFQTTTQYYNATTKQYVTIPYISLRTYSASEAVKYIFNSPTGAVTQPLLSLYAKFTAVPTLPDFYYVNALGYNTTFATDNTLSLKSPLYQDDLQTDTNFSELFLAFNTKNETIGYITYLDKPVPAAENSFAAPDFTVAPVDWKTDLSTMPITINNLEPGTGPNYSAWISGGRKGVGHTLGYGQNTAAVANTVTINAKYPPEFLDTYNYTLSYFLKTNTQAGQPSTYHDTIKRGLVSLPATPTFNAQTDFLASPKNLGYSETGRPTLTWTYTAPASVIDVFAGIYNQTDDADYFWSFAPQARTASSLIVPALSADFAAWDPKGNARKYRFYVNASEYDSATNSPGGNRYSGASRNFSNDTGPASLRARAVNARQRELQDEPNNLDEIKRH
jgi:hypothetical protein